METEAGRTVRKSHEQSVKKRPQFYILLCCTHFCCSCSPSRWMLQVFVGLGFLPEFYFSFSPGLAPVCRAMSGTSTPRTTPGIPAQETSSCHWLIREATQGKCKKQYISECAWKGCKQVQWLSPLHYLFFFALFLSYFFYGSEHFRVYC